jgi:predicted O-linked N-acetylglucosamine transferase (SPINDLY family)
MMPVWQMLDLALQHYRKGEWEQAEQLYLQVLEADPNQADALHILAAITGQTGRDEQAMEYLRAALRIRPSWAEAHNNLGMVFITRRRLPEAVASFQKAVRFNPNFVAAHSNLGNALRELGRPAEAVASLQEAARLGPGQAAAHYNLGLAWLAQGKLAAAVASLQQAVRLKPDYADAHLHLGVALGNQRNLAEAIASFQQVLRLKPDHAEARAQLGLALDRLGKLEASTIGCQQDVSPWPEDAEAHVSEGIALETQGKLAEAVCSYQQALLSRPDSAEAHNKLGNVLRELGQFEEAEASLERALRLDPDHVRAHYNLGILLQKQGRLESALARYRQALRLEPDNAQFNLKVADIFKSQGRLDEALDAFRSALKLNPRDSHVHSALVFTLHLHPRYDAHAIYEECLRWNRQHAEPLKGSIKPHANHPDPERRLRVGYVSPDFREHSCTSFTVPLLANHDHRSCEIFCYADVEHPDAFTERVRGYADVWRDTRGWSDQLVADTIREDQIDILVDLAMHTANNRLPALARKPAPVQVAWLAYPGTTGLSTIDYRLTDQYFDPPGLFDDCYSEESIRLPDTFWCYEPLADQPVNALPARANGFITFGCLNSFPKVNDGCLELWARVLQRVPRARLLLLAPRDPARERVRAKLKEEGIPPERVEFAARLPRTEYFGLYHQIDLAFDPLPCNGGTTTLDALWMGVPTLTLLGQTVAGRAGWSLLCNLGLKELAADTAEQFVALAAGLAGDLPRLQELRANLRQRMQQSPLMDGKRFAQHMEQAYRQIWQRWCRGR